MDIQKLKNTLRRIPRRWFLTAFLIGLGVLFRMWFISLDPQGFFADQWEYHKAATEVLDYSSHIYISTYRMPGYPLILAAVYSLFGVNNSAAWQLLQAFMDSCTGFFIYLIAKKIFRNRYLPMGIFLLYLFNPYTSGYVGVRLTEITATFLLTASFYLFLEFFHRRDPGILAVLSFVLAYLTEVRPGFFYLSIMGFLAAMVVAVKYTTWARRTKLTASLFAIFMFVVPFLYNFVCNRVWWKENSFLTADNLFIRELYISLYVLNQDTLKYPPSEVWEIYGEYQTPETPEARAIMTKKYRDRAIAKIKSDPRAFITTRFQKMWFVWEKHFLFPYQRIGGPLVYSIIYWGNIVILASAAAGFILWTRSEMQRAFYLRFFAAAAVVNICYTTILHAFSITSGRFSIPDYPIIFMFFAYTVARAIFLARRTSLRQGKR